MRWNIASTLSTSPHANFLKDVLYYYTYNTNLDDRWMATAVMRTCSRCQVHHWRRLYPLRSGHPDILYQTWRKQYTRDKLDNKKKRKCDDKSDYWHNVRYTVFMIQRLCRRLSAQGVVTGSGRVGSESLTRLFTGVAVAEGPMSESWQVQECIKSRLPSSGLGPSALVTASISLSCCLSTFS